MSYEIEKNYPRVLVISNNAFSKTRNNGKTLASFFKGFPADHIAQLYFDQETPTDSYYHNFFRITDSDLVNSYVSRKEPGSRIESYDGEVPSQIAVTGKKKIIMHIRKFNSVRMSRELFWMNKKWETDTLDQWLMEFSPEVVFFCAGDSGFAYEVNKYVIDKFNAKSVVYITDDYVLPRKTIAPFWWLRRNFILKKMRAAVEQSNLFITISEEMRRVYKQLFGVDSLLAANMTDSMKLNQPYNENEKMVFIYAGGLHFNRHKTLGLLGKAIKRYNAHKDEDEKEAVLKIYTRSIPDRNELSSINVEGASDYRGSLDTEELKVALNEADVLVHVESFDQKCIESTRLSVSTKIPEYLSIEKPILAIGPNEVASMKYLEDAALCITDPARIYESIKLFLEDKSQIAHYANISRMKHEKGDSNQALLSKLTDNILELYHNQ